MSGTIRAKVNMWVTASAQEALQEIFTNSYHFLNDHPNTTLKSLYYGSGDIGDGNGTNYHDEANSFADGAFAVFTFNTSSIREWEYDVLIQYTFFNDPTPTGSLPFTTTNNNVPTFTIQAAINLDGDPWNGTSNANGTDSKGDPVWIGNASRSLVMPYANTAGTYTDKSYQSRVIRFPGAADVMFYSWADDDGLVFISDYNNDGVLGQDGSSLGSILTVIYPYELIATSSNVPDKGLIFNTEINEAAIKRLSNSSLETGVSTFYGIGAGDLPYAATIPKYQDGYKLETATNAGSFNASNIIVTNDNNKILGYFPPRGEDFFWFTYGATGVGNNAAKDKAYFSLANSTYWYTLMPWTGSVTLGNTSSFRQGETFTI